MYCAGGVSRTGSPGRPAIYFAGRDCPCHCTLRHCTVPQMILDRKWSPKSTTNHPVKTWGMVWILWDWLQNKTDYTKGTFFSPSKDREGWRMVLQKLWVSQNFSQISRDSQSRFLSSYVRLAVSFFIQRCLGVSILIMFKGLEVPIRWFVFF